MSAPKANGNGGGRWSWVGVISSAVLAMAVIGTVSFTIFGYGATANSAKTASDANANNIAEQQVEVAKLQSDISALRAELAAWEKATNDNKGILDKVAGEQAARSSVITGLEENFKEVETQFCADEQIRNDFHSEDLRFRQMMIKKLWPDADYAVANATYPEICNRKN